MCSGNGLAQGVALWALNKSILGTIITMASKVLVLLNHRPDMSI